MENPASKQKKISSLELILKDLRQQMRGRRKLEQSGEDSQAKPMLKSPVGQILLLLVCVGNSLILLSTLFNISLIEVVVVSVLIAVTAWLIFYLIYLRGNR